MPSTDSPDTAPPFHERPFVAVTGADGLIGRAVLDALRPAYRPLALDVKDSGGLPPDVPWIECDLTDDASTRKAIERVAEQSRGQLASVIHLAAYYDFSGEPSPLYEELTVRGTGRLLRALQPLEVEQLVFSSSLLVMAPTEKGGRLTEESPLRAAWDYPASKLRTEELIRERHGSIPAVILRIAGVYTEEGRSIPLAQQMRRIREKRLESFLFPGDADHGQAFVHLRDVADCIRRAVDRRGALGPLEVFLVGEPETLSYRELQYRFGRELHGHRWPTLRVPSWFAKLGAWLRAHLPGREPFIQPWMIDLADANRPISIERARERLGFAPRHRLRDVLPEMVARLQADPTGWYRRHDLALRAEDG